jgi:hypothetical protein
MEAVMDIGMLWFDNDQKTDFQAKVNRAAHYYRNKYGKKPDLCFVHPCMFPSSPKQVDDDPVLKTKGVEVRVSNTMLPNHFWIGINRQESTSAP